VVEIKEKELNHKLEFDSENNGRRYIIDANPTIYVMTSTIQPEKTIDREDGK
jgi:hypothetical protein